MLRRTLLILGAVCMLIIAHLLIQRNVVNNPLEAFGRVPRGFRNYLQNQRLQAPFRKSLRLRRLIYGPYVGDRYVWTAPLQCDAGPDSKRPDQYTVYLHHGYDLSQHKRNLEGRVDLDQVIDPEAPVIPGGDLYELYYSAHLNDKDLAAVRADLGVDMIACEQVVHLDTGPESDSAFPEKHVEWMTEYAECLDRLEQIAGGAPTSDDERETLEQRCGLVTVAYGSE